ncbi:MAG TPA: hypothetical protein VLZ30_08285 [Verrucomicrobiae bacterium]|nr:hypothetical protein [Verrucomicrobiae bacterium]
MSPSYEPSWEELFANDEPAGAPAVLRLGLLRRAGKPLMLVPTNPRLAAVALSLYPAQRSRARLVRVCLRQIWRLGIPIRCETIAITVFPSAPFPEFLAQAAAAPRDGFPPFAILCGNPEVSGRRFVILTFAPDGTPGAVVKAGLGESAWRLIDRETGFLKSVPRGTPAIPDLRGVFQGQNVHALALNFVHGISPAADDYEGVGRLLTSWLSAGKLQQLGNFTMWGALEEACHSHPLGEEISGALRRRPVRPTISHGDFAPWNIKVSAQDGSWIALDWERGELAGIPGWDWFHYVFQYAVLVSRLSVTGAAQRVRNLLHHAVFERYASASAIAGVERELFLAYLISYSKTFGSPAGGADFEASVTRLAGSWPKD